MIGESETIVFLDCDDNLNVTHQEEGNTELEWTLKNLVNYYNVDDTNLKWILKRYQFDNDIINTYSEEWLMKRYTVDNDNNLEWLMELYIVDNDNGTAYGPTKLKWILRKYRLNNTMYSKCK